MSSREIYFDLLKAIKIVHKELNDSGEILINKSLNEIQIRISVLHNKTWHHYGFIVSEKELTEAKSKAPFNIHFYKAIKTLKDKLNNG